MPPFFFDSMMKISEKILYNAYELFKRYGVRSVTMDEIAGNCGVSKKTVYQYFKDKDTLVECIISAMIGKAQEHSYQQSLVAENAIHEIFLSTEINEQMVEGVNPAVMNDLRKYHSQAYAKIEEHKQQFQYSFIKKNIERGISEGLYRNNMKIDVITPFYLHSTTVALEIDVFPRMKYPVADLDFEIMLFLLYGLATPKGAKLVEKYKQKRLKLDTV